MTYDDLNKKLDRFTRGIIRRKVNQLIGLAGFTQQDYGDLEQDFLARVLQSLPSFDPKKAHRNKFITAVVERHFANLLRNKKAAKRDHRRIGSLNVTIFVQGAGPIELAQTIGQRELNSRRGCNPRSDEELAQLVSDVATVMATLPDNWRELAERLKYQSVAEVARDLGIPRTTLHGWISSIRKLFEGKV